MRLGATAMIVVPVYELGETLKPGSRLGAYSLLMPIGEGGMGRVWLASEVGAEHYVALKTSRAVGDEFWYALLDEARIASRIHHPNVCAIHTADHQDGLVYLVMDWSEGASLRELLDASPDRRLPPYLAARIASRVASGLHAVHRVCDDDGEQLGVIHRDVSPQNVLLSTAGQVRLTDFGIAKARGRINAPTQTGQIKGKFAYMSPEQARGGELDGRSDVFALGCVLYEMTTGKAPFRGDDAVSTMYQLLESPLVSPSELVPNYPAGLQGIVLRALAKERERRFLTAEDFARALENFLVAESALILDEEIGELVQETFTDRIQEQREGIDAAAGGIDRYVITAEARGSFFGGDRESTGTTIVHALPFEASEPASGDTGAGAEASGTRRVVTQETPSGGARLVSQRGFWGMWVGTLVVAAAALVLALRNHNQADVTQGALREESVASVPSQPQPASPSEPAAVKEPSPVTLLLEAQPAHAQWFVDDGPALGNPVRLQVDRDSQKHRLRVAAEGYLAQEREVEFRDNLTLALALAAEPEQKKLRRRVPQLTKRREVQEVPPASSAAGQPTSSPAPSARTQPTPRELDTDNPFRAQ